MSTAILLTAALTAIMLAALGWHIQCNPELPVKNRRYLGVTVIMLFFILADEGISLLIDGKTDCITGYYILVLMELLLSAWVVPALLEGFGFSKESRIVAVASALFSLFALCTAPWKLLFFISEEGRYTAGALYTVQYIWHMLLSLSPLYILYGLAKRFGGKEKLTLVLTGVLVLLGELFAEISDNDMVRTICFALILTMMYTYYETLSGQRIHEQLRESNARNEKLSLQMVRSMVSAVDAKDKYTNGHSLRVSEYAVLLGKELGWDDERLRTLKYEALMHDVGKIGIPDSVLNKPGRLSNAEFGIIKSHTIFGADILDGLDEMPGAYQAARWHHERYDGKGYPDGKKGEEIPESARIISIADSFDAMNSDRIYRRALPMEIILQELEKGKGSQFDPGLTDVFMELCRNGSTGEIAALGKPGETEAPDAVTEELRDFFDSLDVAREELGEREDDSARSERIYKYLSEIAEKNRTDAEFALVSVVPGEGFPAEGLDSATEVMLAAVGSSVPGLIAAGRVSKTEIIAVRRASEGPDISSYLQLALAYYYKLFKTDGLDVSFRVLSRQDKG